MKVIYKPDNDNKLWSIDTIGDKETLPEGYTFVEPPKINYKLIFDWQKNQWIETATEWEKKGFETEEEAYTHEAEQHVEELLREHDEKRMTAEKQLLHLVAEQYLLSNDLTDEQKQIFTSLYPLWMPDMHLSVGDKVVYGDDVYEVVQEHVSQLEWLPTLVPALYKIFYQRVVEDENGETEVIPEWVQPLGSHDAYNMGDKVSHDGKIYESKSDGNIWMPGVYGWEEI